VALEKDTRASIEREIGLSETSYNKALEQVNKNLRIYLERLKVNKLWSEVALQKDTRASIEREIGLSETSFNKALERVNKNLPSYWKR